MTMKTEDFKQVYDIHHVIEAVKQCSICNYKNHFMVFHGFTDMNDTMFLEFHSEKQV